METLDTDGTVVQAATTKSDAKDQVLIVSNLQVTPFFFLSIGLSDPTYKRTRAHTMDAR